MLLKGPKSLHVDRLRIMLLLEANFNFNNKRLRQDIMRSIESNGQIAQEHFGGTKNTAIELSINKCITYNIIRHNFLR